MTLPGGAERGKIKVCILAPYGWPSKYNGLGMHVNKITEYLSARDDIELHVITIADENKQFKKGNLNIHTLKNASLLPFPFSIPFLA